MKPIRKTVASQPSWILRNRQVELAVTRMGGHMAPVTFRRDTASPVQPYYISPWQGEGGSWGAPVLGPLRGDFFCMPFGDNATAWHGESHPPHGETAGRAWRLAGAESAGKVSSLMLEMRTRVRRGKVAKSLSLRDGHNAVYIQHTLTGLAGPMPLGHHAILAADGPDESMLVATGAVRFGMTCPGVFGDPANRDYQSLAAGQRFVSLRRVPLIFKTPAFGDCTRFPTRTGFTDLLAVFHKPGEVPAWTAVTHNREGWIWFALKDPAVLPATVLWIANRGRHAAPWNGRNRCLAVEDACTHFADGLAASARPNKLTRAGVATALKLTADRPTIVRHIQGVVKAPRTFGHVKAVRFAPGTVTFISAKGGRVRAGVNWGFLQTGNVG